MSGEQLVAIAKRLLLFVGVWTLHLKENNIFTKMYKIYSVITKVIYCTFVTSLLAQFIILLTENNNPERIILSLSILIIILENATKCVIYQINKIPYMFNDIIENEQQIWMSRDEEIKEQYKKQVKFCRVINILQLIAIITAIGNFAMLDFRIYFKHGKTAFKNKAFLHDNWYPFEKEDHWAFVIFIQIYFCIIGGSINVATLTTFAVLIVYAGTKLRLLQIRIKNVGKDTFGEVVPADVKKLVQEHQYIISFVYSLNERTKYVMLMDFLLNSINLAIGVMQGLKAIDSAELIYAASLLFLVLLQVFAFAWVANEVKIQSMGVADAVYNCMWYDQNEEIKTLLHVMLMRAQRPLHLTIGPFNPMTNETALTMVKAAYTYLTIMKDSYQ